MTTLYRRMTARRSDEDHRAATPLELLFDLSFVVAVASAAAKLHHALAEDHIGSGVLGYLLVFFAIWWGWLNFTWFASAYDTDDVPYRLTTLVQVGGVLVLAAGVPRAFDHSDYTVITIGYVVMRLAMVAQWLRAASADAERRACARRYAVGITVVQVGWVARLLLPDELFVAGFLVMVVAELAVPVWAERAGRTTWHPHHVVERYGLFTLIVLGESILAATGAIGAALDAGHASFALISLAVAGLVIVFAMWWLYFDYPAHHLLETSARAFAWGYGHYLVFASAAAVGAGLEVAVDHDLHVAHLPALGAGLATTVPVAVFLVVVWLLQVRPARRGAELWAFPTAAVLVLAVTFTPAPVHAVAIVLVALVALVVSGRRATAGAISST
ncbi:low temperature requirement protein A [Saccharothrix texasensis]|uniref:Low temperature requirement protein LtrA n=1 Tax=Saccharothrix texasensis TaxID=103734 RepID=A0A3N1HIW7_9PSEU|nr:low temperature requirement protein A [Saccharothrix texasensis]ROP42242.1 low temperature requirement protein LtrA [Saccharothrix texasensis]